MSSGNLTVHKQHGFFMSWFSSKQREGVEYRILALRLATALIVNSVGAWSVDALIARQRRFSARW